MSRRTLLSRNRLYLCLVGRAGRGTRLSLCRIEEPLLLRPTRDSHLLCLMSHSLTLGVQDVVPAGPSYHLSPADAWHQVPRPLQLRLQQQHQQPPSLHRYRSDMAVEILSIPLRSSHVSMPSMKRPVSRSPFRRKFYPSLLGLVQRRLRQLLSLHHRRPHFCAAFVS
jgi:hypothetical protein